MDGASTDGCAAGYDAFGCMGDLEVRCDCCGLRFVVGECFAFLAVGEEAQQFACGEKGTEGVGNVFVVAHDVDIVGVCDDVNVLVEVIRGVEGWLEGEAEEEGGQGVTLFDSCCGLDVGVGCHASEEHFGRCAVGEVEVGLKVGTAGADGLEDGCACESVECVFEVGGEDDCA